MLSRFAKSLIVFASICFSCSIWSQSVDTGFAGTATDSSGAVLPNATITISSAANGFSRTVSTGSQGEYELRYLKPGSYDIRVSAPGFGTQAENGVVLQIGQLDKLDFKLSAASTQQVVEVQATQPLLQSENASLGAVIGPERTQNLPLNGRKFDDLSVLTPGVSVYNPDVHSSSTDGSTISSNGGRSTWGQINVDGVTMVNNRHAYVNLYPSIDAIQEFRVQTGNYSSEYGGSAGANVNIQLKSGTNEFHGSAFEFIRNDAVDARNYFLPSPLPKNVLKQNQFGGTVGGPIVKDKTFFFFSYEGLRSVQQFPGTAIVLTEAQRNGDFSASSTPIINPNTGAAYPNNQIPVDPVARNIIDNYMPLPNIASSNGGSNYAGSSEGNLSVNQYLIRLDHKFSDKDQLFVHYVYANRNFPTTDLNPNFTFTGTYPIHNAALQYLHIFSPQLVNELRLGTDLEHVQQLSTRTGTGFTVQSLGINGYNVGGPNGRPLKPNEEGFPLLEISGYLGMGDDKAASNLDDSRTYQLVDTMTWTKGKHTLVFGADLRHLQDNATTNNTPFGEMDFTSDISGDPAAAFMLGYPRTSLTPEGVPITKARQWRTAEFFQDNWRVTPKLTLNLGVRYDLFAPPVDINNVSRTLDFSTPVPTFTPGPGERLDPIWSISHKDFGPRLGFAYQATPTMVVRGGYSLSYYGGQFDHINILQLNPPTAGSLTITNPSTDPIATIETPVPAALYPANPYFNAVTLPADRKHPDLYLQTYNLTVSKQFGSNVLDISYVGVKGTNEDSSIKNFNSPAPGPGDIQARRPYNTFARIRYQDFQGASNYNGLQTHFEHRLTQGLSLTVAYTFAHELDNQMWDTNGGGCGCQNPRDPHEWASGVTDQRHNLAIGYVWALPSAKVNRALGGVINGWTLDGLIQVASGNPYDIEEASDTQNTDGMWERPNVVPGQKLTVDHRSIDNWFNTAAFTPSIYEYGDSHRNPLVSPATRVLNLSIMKELKMPFDEKQSLQVRFEAFNAFNTPQWSTPDANLGDGNFGKVTSTAIDNRELQLALKYFF
ncbi:TonB-dependent receptor domain-containing protein [Silvibacterium acidisoli]|uniref:TonB-dependent receptor domain-containing protein n=1 Tax=Acidobacteriaceae bacterium ZG23-2 TaxID=2883246 RepID=UPI00406C70E8